MATYPNGTYSATPVSNSDVIDAARDNAQDAEITAIEDGLRTGLQHALIVSTGGLTVSTGNVTFGQNLSVAGNSTIGGTLTVSSNATVSGALSVTGNSTLGGSLVLGGPFKMPTGSTTLSGGSTVFNNVVIPSTVVVLGINGNSTQIAVSGLSSRADGSVLVIVNETVGQTLTLLHESANSSEACRFQLGGSDKAIASGAALWLIRKTAASTVARWRAI